jgi:hypothetical protein
MCDLGVEAAALWIEILLDIPIGAPRIDVVWGHHPAGAVAGFDRLRAAFVGAHNIQWNAFVKKVGENHLTDAFGKVVDDLKMFAVPVLRSLSAGEKFTERWKTGTGWVPE